MPSNAAATAANAAAAVTETPLTSGKPSAADAWDKATAGALVQQPLPGCSVLFFHHLEKTGGTTLRSILQRHAQLGEFDLISFVNRFDKLSLQIVLHRLHTLVEMPGTTGLANLRLAVEIHIGGHKDHPYFNMYALPDLLLLRSLLRAKGCRCNLVTMLRHPLLHHLSWHYHFCNHRVPLCFWRNPPDCQSRLAMGLTCHDGPHLSALTSSHEGAVDFMWRSFDLVGVTELFDEFVLRLTDLAGLQHPAYRSQIVASATLSREHVQRTWTGRTCADLVNDPPADLMGLIRARLEGSAKNAASHLARNGSSSTGGPRGHMECRGYGPCLVDGVGVPRQAVDMRFDADKCAAVTAVEVLRRTCANMAMDERLYLGARKAFEERLGVGLAGVALAARAEAQKGQRSIEQATLAGNRLRRDYSQSSGGGVPWKVNELDAWYMAHERARYSCVECSGDVVPEKDLLGCWPLWTQFAPDEMRYRCNRSWTADPGDHSPAKYRSPTEGAPMPCWQSCWSRIGSGEPSRSSFCTAACPAKPQPAAAWRAAWDAQLERFVSEHAEGAAWKTSIAFVKPLVKESFIFNVY